jgi:integrase/recombinase XerD
MRAKLEVDWSRETKESDLKPALSRYRRYLTNMGFRESTIEFYVFRAGKYLEFAKTDQPSSEDFIRFREALQDKRLARSTLNQYGFSIRKYHEMIKCPITFPFLKPNDAIPYFFNEEDVSRIFQVIHNLKHYAMLQLMFFGCLRASELCSLNDEDVDFEASTIRIREGKGGKQAIVPLNSSVARILQDYLKIRPKVMVDGEQPLFVTDYYRRWDRMDMHRMFSQYKKKAGIEKRGGLHVFGGHSPASLMIKNGCDIMTVKEIMRHKDIETTLRYLHVPDATTSEI